MHLPVGASTAKLSAKIPFELWDQFLPRMLCQLPYPLPALNFTAPPGQTTGQKSGKQLTVRAAPTQHVLSEGTLLVWSFEWLDLLDTICGFLITPLGQWFSTWGYWFDPQTVGHLGGVIQPCELWTHQKPTKTARERRRISLGPPQWWQSLPSKKAGVVLLLGETSIASTRGCQVKSVWFELLWQFL